MTTSQRELWRQIRDFDIDGGPVRFSYAQRLAKENGWTKQHAKKVVEEYKRFVFLAAVAGHPVSPSDAVDQAWHLHMLYTDSYWNRLSAQVLKKPLHHGPSKGGKQEADKFEDWYAKTLASYRALFDEEPPKDVWNQDKKTFKRVDAQENWVLPKRPVKIAAIALAGVAALIGCEANEPVNPSVPLFIFLGVGVVMALVIAKIIRQNGSVGGSCSTHSSCGSGCGNTHSHGGHGGHDGGHGHDGGDSGDGGGCGSSCGGGCGGGGD